MTGQSAIFYQNRTGVGSWFYTSPQGGFPRYGFNAAGSLTDVFQYSSTGELVYHEGLSQVDFGWMGGWYFGTETVCPIVLEAIFWMVPSAKLTLANTIDARRLLHGSRAQVFAKAPKNISASMLPPPYSSPFIQVPRASFPRVTPLLNPWIIIGGIIGGILPFVPGSGDIIDWGLDWKNQCCYIYLDCQQKTLDICISWDEWMEYTACCDQLLAAYCPDMRKNGEPLQPLDWPPDECCFTTQCNWCEYKITNDHQTCLKEAGDTISNGSVRILEKLHRGQCGENHTKEFGEKLSREDFWKCWGEGIDDPLPCYLSTDCPGLDSIEKLFQERIGEYPTAKRLCCGL